MSPENSSPISDPKHTGAGDVQVELARRPSWRGHLKIARVDHWFKNVFAVPGLVLGIVAQPHALGWGLLSDGALALLALCLMASSNYTVNELVDARFDREHPEKRLRPVPAGEVLIPLAYVQWLVLGLAAGTLAFLLSWKLCVTLAALWVMGALYNLPPIRTKDVAYLDVLSEAVNNPIRLLAGWFIVDPAIFPPASLLLSYWMVGCYFMALKRFAEYRAIGDPERAAAYRRSFRHYSEVRLLVSVMFYASASMLFFGAFVMRYRLELVLAFPLVAWVMASYLSLAFEKDSAVQRPEELYRSRRLMVPVSLCTLAMASLLVVDVNTVHVWLAPWGPENW